jgi:hypothetical protein
MTYALVLLLASAAPAGAGPAVIRADGVAPEKLALRLASPEDVARLCRTLEPAERFRPDGDAVDRGEALSRHETERDAALRARYEVLVPAAGLAFAPYDGPERRLALTEPVQIPVGDGTGRLWPVEERALSVEVEAAGARRVLDAQRAGRLSLSLTFDLPDDATCGTGARGTRFTVPVDPVAWRWVDGGAAIAGGGAAADRPLLTVSQGARPTVDVGDPLAGPAEAKKVVLSRTAELEACYAEALRRDPGADGVLVADIGGQRPSISADSVGDADLAACVQRALGPVAPVGGGKVAVPIRFELVAPGAAAPAKAR